MSKTNIMYNKYLFGIVMQYVFKIIYHLKIIMK
jgi:hypothetical protein